MLPNSDQERARRVVAEYVEPMQLLRRERVQDTIVFSGSAGLALTGPLGGYCEEARELARQVTKWAKSVGGPAHRFVVCTGGGGGILEAANRGACEAGGPTITFAMAPAREQGPGRCASRHVHFDFHHFFMRKLWLANLARALVVFPGGFDALDELAEMLALGRAATPQRRIPIVLYGSVYWKEVVNFDALVRYGVVAPEDLRLFAYADDPDGALRILQQAIRPDLERRRGTLAP